LAQPRIPRLYLIPVLCKALDILDLLEREKTRVPLEDIFQRVKIPKTTVYRILKTLVHRGYLAQSPDGRYHAISRSKKIRFGFASQSASMPFSEEVRTSLQLAATHNGVDLQVLDNQYSAEVALENAKRFVASNVDLVIEFQIDDRIAPIIGHTITSAGIPLIAIGIPHPYAVYFGVDNFQVGFDAGDYLAQYAVEHWKSKVDYVVGLEITEAGSFVQSRVAGSFAGVSKRLPNLPEERFIRLDCGGLRQRSYSVMEKFINTHKGARILVTAANDTIALGALRAVREAKLEKTIVIIGQDCIPEALDELRSNRGGLIASVSHETVTYGPRLIQLGLSMLRGNAVPPYNFVGHQVITPGSLK
jgi:ribose transport system substrate-binding protein